MTPIASIHAREILDSRGRPTVECDVVLDDGSLGRASVPSGASTAAYEAYELRDGDQSRYRGLGVRRAVLNIEEQIGPALAGRNPLDQRRLDLMMIEMDGTPNKASLGANAILAVSIAITKASAIFLKIPLHSYISEMADGVNPSLPLPRFNMISGGAHADHILDIQDVLVIPTGALSFREALENATRVHRVIADRLGNSGYPRLAADEGGWAPPLESNETAISWVADAIRTANVEALIALDVASSQFYDDRTGIYELRLDGAKLTSAELVELLKAWVATYPIVSVEDALAPDDWEAWNGITDALGANVELVGDDLFATDIERLRKGVNVQAGNAILIKPNQVGTVTETIDVIKCAKDSGFATIVSARSGDTEDTFVADLAVGTGAGQIKVGSITGSSRNSKWNQLLRIEGEIGSAQYVGQAALRTPPTSKAPSMEPPIPPLSSAR